MKVWLIKSWKTLASVVGAMGIVSLAIGGVIAADTRYAKSAELSTVEVRLDIKIIQDRINGIQERLWIIEDRWTVRFKAEFDRLPNSIDELKAYMSEDVRETYRQLEMELQKLQEELRKYKEYS